MEALIALVLAVVVGAVLRASGLLNVARMVGAFAETFAGWRPDPWPRGVQEEDRDRPWGRSATQPEPPARPMAAPLMPVKPVTRLR